MADPLTYFPETRLWYHTYVRVIHDLLGLAVAQSLAAEVKVDRCLTEVERRECCTLGGVTRDSHLLQNSFAVEKEAEH